ncbi:MAG: ABC transporter ATP-binding protein, partial [Alphaproteobacteria bacterium]|nr:ABC transporter ATP-binding protein [Alphaproteobacteria bacterium]
MPVLDVEDLHVRLATRNGPLHAVRGVSFSIEQGETFALVGESGCGKSMTALSLLDLMPHNGKRDAKRLRLDGVEIGALAEPALRRIRGERAAMIFQEPMTALNPVLTIGEQLIEGPLLHHSDLSPAQAERRALDLLERCGISQPAMRLKQYPHELSGGMRQRAMIAMALMGSPRLLIADEPTTALDVTVQAQILDLLRDLQRELNLAILFITHDLTLVQHFAHRVGVMYAGELVETGTAQEVISAPRHPYTARLVACAPGLDVPRGAQLGWLAGLPPRLTGDLSGCQFRFRCAEARADCDGEIPWRLMGSRGYRCVLETPPQPSPKARSAAPVSAPETAVAPLLELRKVSVAYQSYGALFTPSQSFVALKTASLVVARGTTMGLVGESGSGKSTLARAVLGLEKPISGEILIGGRSVGSLESASRARAVQPVFQDPNASLNPRHIVLDIVRAPLDVLEDGSARDREARARAMLERCGLASYHFNAYPSQLSGGQRQRVAIARALVSGP